MYTFNGSLIERDAERIRRFLEITKDYAHIIIDVTGNGGGVSNYWLVNLVAPLGGQYAYTHYVFFSKEAVDTLPIITPLSALLPIEELPSEVVFVHPEDMAMLDLFSSRRGILIVETPNFLTAQSDGCLWMKAFSRPPNSSRCSVKKRDGQL